MAEPVRTTCPYCGVGCGVCATADPAGGWRIDGDPDHPANRGRLCSKGAALGETLDESLVDRGRLLQPMIDGRAADWATALDLVADRFRDAIDRHGPDAVAFYVSGQLLTEDYYVANKLMKGFIGSANIDTNSRLCMASAVAGHRRAFGEDVVPACYDDLEQADLVVLVGSNLAWCHPVLHQRLLAAATRRGSRIVVVDPRRTDSCDAADLHLALRPGSDVLLFAGLLAELAARGALDAAATGRLNGFDAALAAAQAAAPDRATVAAGCGLDAADLGRFYDWFAATPATVTLFSQGVNQSSRGTDKANAILNCHLATGRIGRPGCGPFSITGQPNAMGGREVGGLANQLAAHMGFGAADRDRVGRFWRAPNLAAREGLKAVELFQAVGDGRIKALWIAGTNPAVSLPDAAAVRAAIAACPFVVVSDCTAATDTAALAHVLLPAAGWSEKDGTVTNSERCISRQRPFRPAPGAARPDWWMFTQLAHRLGWTGAFAYHSAADIFREHAALSAFENHGDRRFDIGALAGLDQAGYDALMPVQWPVMADGRGTARLFADGRFSTADHRPVAVTTVPAGPARPPGSSWPYSLNTGRIRDQWHTMTRTGLVPRLSRHEPEPFVQVHPDDAAAAGLTADGLAMVSSERGRAVVRVRVSPGQRPGALFVPMHWNDQFAAAAAVNRLIDPITDPVSGQPELKHTPARLAPFAPGWQAFLLTAADFAGPNLAGATDGSIDYWARSRVDGGQLFQLAGTTVPDDLEAWAARLLGTPAPALQFHDRRRGSHRWARLDHGQPDHDRLVACLFLEIGRPLPDRDWLLDQLAAGAVAPTDRAILLSGRSPGATPGGQGKLVCACFGVGANRLLTAIRDGGLTDARAVGAALRAGTNCGSCIPEIKALIDQVLAPAAVA